MTRVTRMSVFISATALVGSTALAQTGNGYDLNWNTLDGGGAMFSTGGGYELGGTIGQPDAGGPMTGGGFEMTGGFWPGAQLAASAGIPTLSEWGVIAKTHVVLVVGMVVVRRRRFESA
jgi:hypothetical protein